MKRILNLNQCSIPALTAILLVGGVLPALMFLFSRWLGLDWLTPFIEVLLAAGAVMLLLFLALVALELIQDDVLYRNYLRHREKQPEVEGECQFCGNRRLRPFEPVCPVCGAQIHHTDQTSD